MAAASWMLQQRLKQHLEDYQASGFHDKVPHILMVIMSAFTCFRSVQEFLDNKVEETFPLLYSFTAHFILGNTQLIGAYAMGDKGYIPATTSSMFTGWCFGNDAARQQAGILDELQKFPVLFELYPAQRCHYRRQRWEATECYVPCTFVLHKLIIQWPFAGCHQQRGFISRNIDHGRTKGCWKRSRTVAQSS